MHSFQINLAAPFGRASLLVVLAASAGTVFADTVSDSLENAAPAGSTVAVRTFTATTESGGKSEFGTALDAGELDAQRGGTDAGVPLPLSTILASGTVSDNRAVDVVTGSNAIRDGAFANASGIPVVIQNTGANVLIQNATIVNIQLR